MRVNVERMRSWGCLPEEALKGKGYFVAVTESYQITRICVIPLFVKMRTDAV